MTDKTTQAPRYKASYRWVSGTGLGFRRGQQWFVKDTRTGEVVAEHFMWTRADAEFHAKQMNKREESGQ